MRKRSPEVKERIIDYVDAYYMDHGHTPSTTEIAKEIGHSRSTAYFYLVEMDKEGMIKYEGDFIRTDRMTKQDPTTKRAPIVELEQIRVIDKTRITTYPGRVSRETMKKIDNVLEFSLGLQVLPEMEAP